MSDTEQKQFDTPGIRHDPAEFSGNYSSTISKRMVEDADCSVNLGLDSDSD